jgi:hypothetical protein
MEIIFFLVDVMEIIYRVLVFWRVIAHRLNKSVMTLGPRTTGLAYKPLVDLLPPPFVSLL